MLWNTRPGSARTKRRVVVILTAVIAVALFMGLVSMAGACGDESTPGPQDSPGPAEAPGPGDTPGPAETPGPQDTPGP